MAISDDLGPYAVLGAVGVAAVGGYFYMVNKAGKRVFSALKGAGAASKRAVKQATNKAKVLSKKGSAAVQKSAARAGAAPAKITKAATRKGQAAATKAARSVAKLGSKPKKAGRKVKSTFKGAGRFLKRRF